MRLQPRFDSLQTRHGAVDARLFEEDHRPKPNDEEVARLKREKLRLKDEMERIRSVSPSTAAPATPGAVDRSRRFGGVRRRWRRHRLTLANQPVVGRHHHRVEVGLAAQA